MKARGKLLIGSAAVLLAGGLAACSTDTKGSGESGRAATSQRLDTGVNGTVWVANEKGNSISVLDARSARVVTTLTGVGSPHNVQAGADGDAVYVVSGAGSTVAAIDSRTYALNASASTGAEPAHVIEAAGKVYVTSADQAAVDVYRTGKLERLATLALGGMPHGLRASRDGALVAVANMGGKSVDLIDTKTERKTSSISVGGPPVQVAVEPTGDYVYASVSKPASLVKIDTKTRKVIGTVAVPAPPVQVYLTGDGGTLVSADQGDDAAPGHTLSIIDTREMNVTKSVQVGNGPHGVTLDPAAKTAWVTNLYDDTVSVIDLPRAKVIATVPVGDKPNGISLSSRTPQPAPSATVPLPMPSTSHGGGHDEGHGEGMDHG
jgi:YVTN family beta-propeller protein